MSNGFNDNIGSGTHGSVTQTVKKSPKPAPAYIDDDGIVHPLTNRGTDLAAALCDIKSEDELIQILDRSVGSKTLLEVLKLRGGHPGALAEAALLCAKKSEDYNHGQSDIHVIDRSSYFPFGAVSYAQMLHTKSARFVSLAKKQSSGGEPNFEGLRDTAIDIINYGGFYLSDKVRLS